MMHRLIFVLLVLTAACTEKYSPVSDTGSDWTGSTDSEDGYNENPKDSMESNTIRLTVNDRSFTATLEANSSAEALKERLAKGDVSIRMRDYGGMEKVGSLGFSLPQNNAMITTRPGDLILYQGNSFVIYYDTNSWSLTRLGRVDGVSSRSQMLELLGGTGEVTVTLSLE